MRAIAVALSANELAAICGSAAVLAVAAALGVRAWKRSRITPAERERRRRTEINARGKLGDATLVEVRDQHLFYSYDVRGVEYTASQDISALAGQLPTDEAAVNKVVYIKYDPRNPANSIVLCEGWSGLGSPTAGIIRK